MILEVTRENLRDLAAAVNTARRRNPTIDVLNLVEGKVLSALNRGDAALELQGDEASALRNALLQRAWDQRENSEGYDYSDLADRIARALEDEQVEIDEPQ